ncbi:MAG: DNA alkylation repair protein [Gammaproteobacteria bacterium]|nr:DNA alkylation repair protein [Gammaproteobacteria bacterium]
MNARTISRELRKLGDADIAEHSQRFFKTGEGEYGEGDCFLGIRVPVLRQHVRQFRDTPGEEIIKLLASKYHEERLFALLMLVDQFRRSSVSERGWIYRQYLANTRYINNWDLVDSSADKIVGAYLELCSRKPLYKLVRSTSLWERRIAIMATFHFIRRNDFDDTLAICELVLNDSHDLIHKAAGWMLREIGKRDTETEKAFLDRHSAVMPRTMLRYAIERFPAVDRYAYLALARSNTY